MRDVGTALIQRLQDVDSVVQTELKSVTDQISVYSYLLITMTFSREHRKQPNCLPELVVRVTKFPN